MTLKEFKEKLNQLPKDCEDKEVVFGEATWGEYVKKIQILGSKIYLSFF